MSTLREDQERVNEALLDLAYAIIDALGLLEFAKRRDWKLRPWAAKRGRA